MDTYIVDSFTDMPFKGNPAGVCIVPDDQEQGPSPDRMLKIAQELNLSETAFVRRTGHSGSTYGIRFFSPKMEIPLCGHATLAAAKVIQKRTEESEIVFTNEDELNLSVQVNGASLEMEFPIYETSPSSAPPELLQALGIESVVNVRRNRETNILLLEIASTVTLRALQPDFAALVESYAGINGVLVTAAHDREYDYHSRYFWPWSGTNEDPVTGGIQTFLGKYWSQRLGKSRLRAFQSSARTGSMEVELRDDRLFITGQAVIVFQGALLW